MTAASPRSRAERDKGDGRSRSETTASQDGLTCGWPISAPWSSSSRTSWGQMTSNGRRPTTSRASILARAINGPVLTTRRSAIPQELDFRGSILLPEVGNGDPNPRQRQQEIDPALAAKAGGLPRGQPPELVELGSEKKTRLLQELLFGKAEAEKQILAILDRQTVRHRFSSSNQTSLQAKHTAERGTNQHARVTASAAAATWSRRRSREAVA